MNWIWLGTNTNVDVFEGDDGKEQLSVCNSCVTETNPDVWKVDGVFTNVDVVGGRLVCRRV